MRAARRWHQCPSSERQVLEDGPLLCKSCLSTYRLSSVCVAPKTQGQTEQKVWSMGTRCRGCSHLKAPILAEVESSPVKPVRMLFPQLNHTEISLMACQIMSKHQRERVCVLPPGTPIYIPVPFSAVCDNMPDFTPK